MGIAKKFVYLFRLCNIKKEMGPIGVLILTAFGIVSITLATAIIVHKRSKNLVGMRVKTVERLCAYLLPGDKKGTMRQQLVADLHELTGHRFTDEEVLDYYLIIKGLQMVDLNTLNDPDTRRFLMEPTKIKLHYQEVVSFYEKYLNQPRVKGQSAI